MTDRSKMRFLYGLVAVLAMILLTYPAIVIADEDENGNGRRGRGNGPITAEGGDAEGGAGGDAEGGAGGAGGDARNEFTIGGDLFESAEIPVGRAASLFPTSYCRGGVSVQTKDLATALAIDDKFCMRLELAKIYFSLAAAVPAAEEGEENMRDVYLATGLNLLDEAYGDLRLHILFRNPPLSWAELDKFPVIKYLFK